MVNSVRHRKLGDENVSTGLIPFFESIITLKNDNNVNRSIIRQNPGELKLLTSGEDQVSCLEGDQSARLC